jgi:hydroxymethylbilane synthase
VSLQRPRLRIGTRESRLARWQAEHVASAIRALAGAPEPELVLIRTEGDRIQDVPLSQVQGKAFFTKEIEEALLRDRVDVAVHSLKDLATQMPGGLVLGAVMERDDPRDALLLRGGLDQLPAGATVGTSSLRRRAFLARWRPDLELAELRGNVPTRIRKLDEGRYDAIVLAAAGVKRLGLEARISDYLPFEFFLPAVSQGAIGVQIRADDVETAKWVGHLDHPATRWATAAERALLRTLEGGCQVPVGALAQVISDGQGSFGEVVWAAPGASGAAGQGELAQAGQEVSEAAGPGVLVQGVPGAPATTAGGPRRRLWLRASLCSLDGKRAVEGERWAPVEEAQELGITLAEELYERGGDEILDEIRKASGGR